MLHFNQKIDADADFAAGAVLLIDKPIKWSSFDVVKKIRGILKSNSNYKKIKVGHAGTLDPLATGLLIICTGKYTKKISEIQNEDKTYTGEITLGGTTPSFDKETKVNKTYKTDHINEDMIHSKCDDFIGEILQYPPIFSALKINGKRLYKYARDGEIIKTNPRLVTVRSFEITKISMPKLEFKISCGKGTYIRSLANDYALSLNTGGHISKLQREKIGTHTLKNALSINEFEKLILKTNIT